MRPLGLVACQSLPRVPQRAIEAVIVLRENSWETSQKTIVLPKMMLVEPDTHAGGSMALRVAGSTEVKLTTWSAASIKLPLLLVPRRPTCLWLFHVCQDHADPPVDGIVPQSVGRGPSSRDWLPGGVG